MLVSCHVRFQNSVHNGLSIYAALRHQSVDTKEDCEGSGQRLRLGQQCSGSVCFFISLIVHLHIFALCNTFVNPNLFELTHLRTLRETESEDESAWNEAVEAHEANTKQLWPTIMCRRLFTYFIINLDYQHIRTNVLLKAHQYESLK